MCGRVRCDTRASCDETREAQMHTSPVQWNDPPLLGTITVLLYCATMHHVHEKRRVGGCGASSAATATSPSAISSPGGLREILASWFVNVIDEFIRRGLRAPSRIRIELDDESRAAWRSFRHDSAACACCLLEDFM